MATLTGNEREQVEAAEAEARQEVLHRIEQERAQRRMTLDREHAVEAYVFTWPFLDLRHIDSPDDIPNPPDELLRLQPRTAALLPDDDPEEWETAGRLYTKPGEVWKAEHTLSPPPGRSNIAIEALPQPRVLSDVAAEYVYGWYCRIALWGEVETFTRPGQPARSVTRHGSGHTTTDATPESSPLWRGTRAEVTGIATDGDDRSVYLHKTHGFFANGDGTYRKYPNTEKMNPREWLASEFARVWDVPVVDAI